MTRRIVHVVDTLGIGGAEVLVAQLCREQQAAGLAPEVHWLLESGPVKDMLEANGIPVLGHRLSPGIFGKLAFFRRFAAALTGSPCVVHSHNANAATLAALPAALARRPHVCTRHGLVPPGMNPARERKFWLAARLLQRVVAVCDVAARNLQAAAGSHRPKVITVRNGALGSVRGEITIPTRADSRQVVLLTVARLSEAKDQPTLLRALALARREFPGLVLWIVGDGPEGASLRSLASELHLDDAVHFWGQQTKVGAFLDAADVFVLSSVSEGLPVSLLEAMEAGLPQIVTAVGGMPEVVELAKSGVVVPAQNPEALAAAIAGLAANASLRATLGASARAAYQEEFTLATMHRKYLLLYEEISS